MKDTALGNTFTGILCLCALAITGMLVRREFFPPKPSLITESKIANWREFKSGQPLGRADGAVSLIVFSDYQCPACRSFSSRVDSLRSAYPTQLSIYYRNLPIPSHRFARVAAFAAECAAMRGQFAQAHQLLFQEVDSIGLRSWGRFASKLGISDTASFGTCIRDSMPAHVVQRDERDARRLNINGTPALLLEEDMIVGAPTMTDLNGRIERLVKKR